MAKATAHSQRPNRNLLVGAYYYPWYYNDFHHKGKTGYLRSKLDPPQEPQLGEYNDRTTHTMRQHLTWCLHSNINLWVTSWWGEGKREDVTTKVIMEYLESQIAADDFKLALFYETTGLIKEKVKGSRQYDTCHVKDDLKYIAETYFGRRNYLKIDGKPVLFVYLTRVLDKSGILQDVITLMRKGAAEAGFDDIYIVGDHAFGKPPKDECVPAFNLLDAVTNYDVFGSMQRPLYAGVNGVEAFRKQQHGWQTAANKQSCSFIPSVTPGFNNLCNKNLATTNYGPMSRRLSQKDKEGSLFAALLQNAITLVDKDVNMIMITSFNEWHEDSQIEPIKTSGGSTTEPQPFTHGIEYQAYGMTYLELVKKYTT